MRLCGERTGFISRMDYGGEGGKEEGRRERREEASLGALFVLVAPGREREREREGRGVNTGVPSGSSKSSTF